MELKEGIYTLPDNLRAVVEKGIVKVFPKSRTKNLKERGIYRCKDCTHYVLGRAKAGKSYLDRVCELRPKKNTSKQYPEQELYYAALKYGIPCEKFELA